MQLAKALLCQIIAGFAVLLLSSRLPGWGHDFWFFLTMQALTATAISSALRQPAWWRFIHLLFLPAAALLLSLNIAAWVYLLIFLLMTLVFWGTVKGDVPLFLSSPAVSEALATILAKENTRNFADIGAGLGSVVAPVAKKFPNLRIVALEKAPLPWLIGFWRCRNLANVDVRLQNLWNCNLSEYGVVFAFLSPLVMVDIGEKVRQEMQAGSLFVSSSFAVPEWPPEEVVELGDRQKSKLYCYRIRSCSNCPQHGE